jgi:hypothetical protein
MAVVAEPAEHVSELLQTLKMDTQVQACDMTTSEVPPSSQDGSCSDGSRDAASVSGGSGNAASTNAATQEGSVDAGMYYVNGYPTPHAYVYDYPHGGENFPH